MKILKKKKKKTFPPRLRLNEGAQGVRTSGRAHEAAALLASPSSYPALWEKSCHLELKWKLHSKANCKQVKHLQALPLASVKDCLKPLLLLEYIMVSGQASAQEVTVFLWHLPLENICC